MQVFWGPCANRSWLVFGEQGVPGSFWHCMSLARSVSMPLFAARNITRILSDILCVLWSLNTFCGCSFGNKGAVGVVRHVANVLYVLSSCSKQAFQGWCLGNYWTIFLQFCCRCLFNDSSDKIFLQSSSTAEDGACKHNLYQSEIWKSQEKCPASKTPIRQFWHCMSLARSVSMPSFSARNITRILSDYVFSEA